MSDVLDFLTEKQAAKVLHSHQCTLKRSVMAGKGPIVTMFGRKRLYRRDHLIEWAEFNAIHAPAKIAGQSPGAKE